MASSERRGGGETATRLQRRAPSSIQISRPANWNVAIPLLSPLVSPAIAASCYEEVDALMAEKRGREEVRSRDKAPTSASASTSATTKWKHPAAPFYYGPVPKATPFVPV